MWNTCRGTGRWPLIGGRRTSEDCGGSGRVMYLGDSGGMRPLFAGDVVLNELPRFGNWDRDRSAELHLDAGTALLDESGRWSEHMGARGMGGGISAAVLEVCPSELSNSFPPLCSVDSNCCVTVDENDTRRKIPSCQSMPASKILRRGDIFIRARARGSCRRSPTNFF